MTTDHREQTRAGLQALLSVVDQLDPDVRVLTSVSGWGAIKLHVTAGNEDAATILAEKLGMKRLPDNTDADGVYQHIRWGGEIGETPAELVVLIPNDDEEATDA